ncbi:hypothetical protein ACHQM5_028660 [Ranunculus cassubicifolius]
MIILRSLCLFVVIALVCSSPPEDPIKCSSQIQNCTVTNSYGMFPDRVTCQAAQVIYPTTEKELVDVLAKASMENKKIKVVTKYSHSITKLVCPDGKDGLLISTRYLNRIIEVDALSQTMTVESGVTIREVIDQAAKVGLALPSTPYWWGLTLGGVLGTGAHGSTLFGNGSAVHDYVVGIRLVIPAGPDQGYSKVIILDNNHSDMDAAKVSLGVLGVISQVTLQLQPLFKRSVRLSVEDDLDLADKVTSFGIQHEFADIIWYPSQRKAVYKLDDRVSDVVSGNGVLNFIPFRAVPSVLLGLTRSSEEALEATGNADGKCINSRLVTSTLIAAGYGYSTNGFTFTGYPVVGYHNHLQASGSCLDSHNDREITACPWDSRVNGEFFHQTTFSIGFSNVENFIKDVQKLRDLQPNAFCGVDLYNGILMRYVKASSAYLGKEEDGVDFDMTYYRSKNPLVPRLHEDIIEEIEQLAIFKYGGLPHWGKNRNIAFTGVIKKYSGGKKFLEKKKLLFLQIWGGAAAPSHTYVDPPLPMGMFSNEWTNQILGVKGDVNIIRDGCALEGLCICSEDIHCAPSNQFIRFYEDARVCTIINLHG